MRRVLDRLFGNRLSRVLRSQLQTDPVQQAEAALRALPRQIKQLQVTLAQQQRQLTHQEERYLQAVRQYRQLVDQPDDREPAALSYLEHILPRWKDDLETAQTTVQTLCQSLQHAERQLHTYRHEWQRLQQQAQRTVALQQEQHLRDQLQQTAQSLERATIAIANAQWQTAALNELTTHESP